MRKRIALIAPKQRGSPTMSQSEIERRTLSKVSWRVLPLVVAAYFVANLDRSNISYAALQMNQDLHLSAEQFGQGAGLFSLTYLLLEIPSNLALERFGARLWIARIMISWGLISAATAWVVGPTSFISMRLLLGAAEAGLVPGVLLYITYWFPNVLRGRAVAIFLVAAPVSNVVSSLLSVPLLGMDGLAGLRGWQWLLIVEASPAVILGCIVAFVMTNKPSDAKWLSPEERQWLEKRLDEEKVKAVGPKPSWWQVAIKPKVMALAFVYAGRNVGAFGITFFLPQIVRDLGLNTSRDRHGKCLVVLRGCDRHGVVGAQLRPVRRTPLAFDGIVGGGGRRTGGCSLARRFAMVAGGAGDCRHRLLRVPAGDLCDHAFRVVAAGSRQRASLHQLLRAARIDRGSVRRGLDQVGNRQFPECDVLHGGVFDSRCHHCGLHQGAEHSQIDPDRRGRRDRAAKSFLSLK